jgi:hypothetical protein
MPGVDAAMPTDAPDGEQQHRGMQPPQGKAGREVGAKASRAAPTIATGYSVALPHRN